MIGDLNFVKDNKQNVVRITKTFRILTVLRSVIEISLSKYKKAAHIIPTTTALIPSRARNIITYFFKLCQTG